MIPSAKEEYGGKQSGPAVGNGYTLPSQPEFQKIEDLFFGPDQRFSMATGLTKAMGIL